MTMNSNSNNFHLELLNSFFVKIFEKEVISKQFVYDLTGPIAEEKFKIFSIYDVEVHVYYFIHKM